MLSFVFFFQAKQISDRVEEREKLEARLRAQPTEEGENSSDSECERERTEQQKAREEHMKALEEERVRKMEERAQRARTRELRAQGVDVHSGDSDFESPARRELRARERRLSQDSYVAPSHNYSIKPIRRACRKILCFRTSSLDEEVQEALTKGEFISTIMYTCSLVVVRDELR